jgi:hypothetical protein
MDYKQKYLKYKQKYLELKQLGGNKTCLENILNRYKFDDKLIIGRPGKGLIVVKFRDFEYPHLSFEMNDIYSHKNIWNEGYAHITIYDKEIQHFYIGIPIYYENIDDLINNLIFYKDIKRHFIHDIKLDIFNENIRLLLKYYIFVYNAIKIGEPICNIKLADENRITDIIIKDKEKEAFEKAERDRRAAEFDRLRKERDPFKSVVQ